MIVSDGEYPKHYYLPPGQPAIDTDKFGLALRDYIVLSPTDIVRWNYTASPPNTLLRSHIFKSEQSLVASGYLTKPFPAEWRNRVRKEQIYQ